MKVVTGMVRFSYASVFEPKSINAGPEKYSVSILIPKTDTEMLSKIKKAILEVSEAGKAKFGGKVPANLKTPLRDGDLEREDDEAYAGHYFMSANSSTKPGLVDSALNPILDRADFYSGCYGRASVNFYAYNSAGSKGIACGLNNIQKLKDGESLGGSSSSAEEDFDLEDDLM